MSEKDAAVCEKEAPMSEKDAAVCEKEAPVGERDAANNEKGPSISERGGPVPLMAVRIEREAAHPKPPVAPFVQKPARIRPRATRLPRAAQSPPLLLCALRVSAALFSSGVFGVLAAPSRLGRAPSTSQSQASPASCPHAAATSPPPL
jgi:hypothetical protein